jgi:hypothetical protein
MCHRRFSSFSCAEIDLFSFDDPAPVPAAQANNDFGAFQTTPAPAPVEDDEFGSFVASKTASQPDPFAAPTPQPAASPFDAFGNNGGVAPMAFVQNAPPVMHNNNVLGGNMNSMNDAFGNMTMVQSQQATPSVGDDDFGDFAVASKSFSNNAPSIRADPMSKLVSLDGLSKNPNNREWFTLLPGRMRLRIVVSHTCNRFGMYQPPSKIMHKTLVLAWVE